MDSTVDRLDSFTRAYIEAALWTSESDDEGMEYLDAGYGVEDIHPDSLAKIIEDCREFQKEEAGRLFLACTNDEHYYDFSKAGHDYWLTRNGHGAGFWDRGLGAVGEHLTEASTRQGEVTLYLGDDGKIHCTP